MTQERLRIGEPRPAQHGAEHFNWSGPGIEPRQPIGDRARRRKTPPGFEELANPDQNRHVIGLRSPSSLAGGGPTCRKQILQPLPVR
jgi:hypothetical protein